MSLLQAGFLSDKDIQELNSLARRDPKKLSSVLHTSFSNAPCPFDLALKMLRGAQNKKKPRSLCDYVVQGLKRWTQEHPQHDVPMTVKRQIVPIVCDFIKANSQALVYLYQVDKPDLTLVEEHIYRFNQTKDYTKMIFLIATLNLQCPEYTDQLVIPMLVQGENFLAEKYMQGSVGAQRSILLLIDTWLNGFPIEQFRNVSGAFIKHKSLRKLLSRWQELFPLPDLDLPNLRRLKAVGQIRFFLQRYYRETSMSARALEDLVHKYINNDRDMVQSVCKMVHGEFCDPHRARKLQQRYNRRHRGGGSISSDSSVEVWSDDEDDPDADYYLPLKVDVNYVLMVDSVEKLSACEQDLHNMEGFATSEEYKLIGFDAEWSNEELSLIQLAVFDKVFLVDVFKFRQMRKTNELAAFVGRLFKSKRLLKLAFGVGNDLKLLRQEFKASMPDQPANLLDVMKLRNANPRYKLLPESKQDPTDHCGKKLTGLSRIVFQTLGKPLDKREQISDWERRPLHLKQAIYAATDAYCLLQVYVELDKRLTESGAETSNKSLFSIACEPQTADGKKQKKSQQTTTTEASTSSSKHEPISVRDFRVMCDNMLGGLCKTLRNLGMDATERDANMTIEECVEVAKVEGRHILTCGGPYDSFCRLYSREMCTKLKHDDKRNDQALQVVNKYAIQITDEDIFSRCQLCNRDKFLILKGQDMERVHNRKLSLDRQHQPEPCNEILETVTEGGEGRTADVTSHLRMNDLVIVRSSTDDDRPTEVALKFDSQLPSKDRLFFCCSACGKVYWKGGHLSEISQSFANVLVKSK